MVTCVACIAIQLVQTFNCIIFIATTQNASLLKVSPGKRLVLH